MNRSARHVAAVLCSLLMPVQVLASTVHAMTIDHVDDAAVGVSVHPVEAPDHPHHNPADCPLCHFLAEGRAAAMSTAPTTLSPFVAVDLSVPPPVLAVHVIQLPRAIGCRAPPLTV